jgi:CRISPR-associated protein Cas1
MALAAGFRVIRYGDDFAIPVDSRLGGERALQSASTELSDLRLELNAGKCHIASFDEGVRFLGETLTASTLVAAETLWQARCRSPAPRGTGQVRR